MSRRAQSPRSPAASRPTARPAHGRGALALAALIALGAGCASGPRYFEPTERVQGQTVQGYPVALYPLMGPSGAFGEAKLWSDGARESDDRAAVHIGFEVHNTGDKALEMGSDDVRLDARLSDGTVIKGVAPGAGAGTRSFSPGALGETRFSFALPPGVRPHDVRELRLHWRVRGADRSYTQRTAFVRWTERDAYSNPYPYPYPYPYGYACWPYGPYDCIYPYPLGLRTYEPVIVPRYAAPRRVVSRTVSHPKR
jgi:hypothetical protein